MTGQRTPGFNTLAIHAGAQPDPATGARVTPIYQTTSYVFDNAEHAASLFNLEAFGNIYTRIMNPTQAVLEARVAALEGGTAALAAASGHAAQLLAFHVLLEPGDEFIASRQLYGGSINQFNHAFNKFGWNVVWADGNDPASFEAAVSPKTKPSSSSPSRTPAASLSTWRRFGGGQEAGVPLLVDNTLATPYLFRPKEHGADIVLHSLTKFMGGQGTSLAASSSIAAASIGSSGRYPTLSQPNPSYNGMVMGDLRRFRLRHCRRVLSLRDLGPALRRSMRFWSFKGRDAALTHSEALRKCARRGGLAETAPEGRLGELCGPAEKSVYHELAKGLCPKAPVRLHFRVKGGYEAGLKLVAGVKLFSHLANIGDTRSLIIHPASTTHSQLTPESARQRGPATMWCGCRLAWRTRRILSGIWSRRSKGFEDGARVPYLPCSQQARLGELALAAAEGSKVVQGREPACPSTCTQQFAAPGMGSWSRGSGPA